jgi:hypothetical protein
MTHPSVVSRFGRHGGACMRLRARARRRGSPQEPVHVFGRRDELVRSRFQFVDDHRDTTR